VRITAVATAFHPDERLAAVVAAALESCDEVIVVDNTPGGRPSGAGALADLPRVRLLRPGRNTGLAGALNLGVSHVSPDADAVLFLDQDSVLTPEVVQGLATHLADPTIGIAAPSPWDAEHERHYEQFAGRRPEIADRDTVITSGMLVRRELINEVGRFRTEFFVDHVDNDFCLRARRQGARIVRDGGLRLTHSLGQRNTHRVLGMTLASSRHPTWRLYWIARNGVILLREHRRTSPRWVFGTAAYLVQWVVVRTAFEAPRRERLAVMLRGFRDGWRGRTSTAYLPADAAYEPAGAGASR